MNNILAVKRSIHYVIRDSLYQMIDGIVNFYTRKFYEPLDMISGSNETRKLVRDSLFSVWLSGSQDTLNTPFSQNSMIVVKKEKKGLSLYLKEEKGELTLLNRITPSKPFPNIEENYIEFEKIWKQLIGRPKTYPNKNRPIPIAVADIISYKYDIPRPVIFQTISSKYVPSLISLGLDNSLQYQDPREVFSEKLVKSAVENGICEWLDFWTFKVRRNRYQEWRLHILTNMDNNHGIRKNPPPPGLNQDGSLKRPDMIKKEKNK